MTFDQWKRRPVYLVQCFTCSVYRSLGGQIMGLRKLPTYRSSDDQLLRTKTAAAVRQMRRDGLGRNEVRRQHDLRLRDSSGSAIRVDIERELASESLL